MTEFIDVNDDSFDEIILDDNIPLEIETIPFTTLPYAFKERIINLAPVPELSNLYKICPKVIQIRRSRMIERDQVYIASNDDVIRDALQKQRYFNIFKFSLKWFRYALDGAFTFYPTWQSVLQTNTITTNKIPIFVTDTLTINCKSVQQFEAVVPYICGNYRRLSIRGGKISWSQVKRLIHEDITQVQIFAEIVDLNPWDYHDFVLYLKQFLKEFHHRITIRVNVDVFSYELKHQLERAFKNHNTHESMFINHSFCLVNRKSHNIYCFAYAFIINIWMFIGVMCYFFYTFFFEIEILKLLTCFFMGFNFLSIVFAVWLGDIKEPDILM